MTEKILEEFLGGKLKGQRFPVCFMSLSCPSDLVKNQEVHPARECEWFPICYQVRGDYEKYSHLVYGSTDKIEIVKSANIRIVKSSELKVGDKILYMNWECVVISIVKKHGLQVTFHPIFDKSIIETRNFLNWYLMDDCESVVEEIE